MVITLPIQARSSSGLRPINLNKDIPQVMRLLELVFGKILGQEGQRIISGNVQLDRQPAFLWRLTPGVSKLAMGYVWEEDGRIVGNATVLNTKTIGRFLVVNVAVHPDYRCRGIARMLMDTVIDMIRERNGRAIMLQVVSDNQPALSFYESLNFADIGSITTWRSTISNLREIQPAVDNSWEWQVRELHRQEWQAAYELDLTSLHPDLNWPESLPPDIYRGGLWRWVDKLFNARRTETWVIAEGKHRLTGLASIWSDWGRPHRIRIRVHPLWRGQLESALLAKTIRRLRQSTRGNIRLDHPHEDETMNQLLREANFYTKRTLTHMYLEL